MGTGKVLQDGYLGEGEYGAGGQRWAAAVEPFWSWRPHRWLEIGTQFFVGPHRLTVPRHVFQKRIVYCHTSQMQYAREGQPHNICTLHGGRASWERCSQCPDNWGFHTYTKRSIKHIAGRKRVVLQVLR